MPDFEIGTYPSSRVATFDVGRIGLKKHTIVGLVEADVTSARDKIAQRVKAGEGVGFTAWLLKVVATAVEADRRVHAINARRRRQLLFRDIDISIPLEREVRGIRVPLVTVIRKANEKSIEDIFAAMRFSKDQSVASEKDYVLGSEKGGARNKVFFNLPQCLRMAVWRAILSSPFSRKNAMGTVMVTNVGMVGGVSGWIVPKSMHNLCIGVGSISKKPWVVGNEISIREILHLTLLFDHDVVDGSPAARFTARLVRSLESAAGL